MIPDFLVPLAVWWCIQFIKVWIDFFSTQKIHFASFWSAWWFPSVHSGIAASISTLMLLHYGYSSPEFAIAASFSFLFWYDAANVRYEAGQHASFLNSISEELDKTLNLWGKIVMLKERLGHTTFEVMGWIIVGVCLTLVWYIIVEQSILLS